MQINLCLCRILAVLTRALRRAQPSDRVQHYLRSLTLCTHAHNASATTFTLISIESVHLDIQITDDWARACIFGFIVLQLIGNVLPIVLRIVAVIRRGARLAYTRFQQRNRLAPQFGIVDVQFPSAG